MSRRLGWSDGLIAAVDETLRTLERVRLTQVYSVARQGAAAADSVLLALEDGTPWAIRGERMM